MATLATFLDGNVMLTPLISTLGSLFALGTFVAHILIALGIYRDGEGQRIAGGRTRIFSPLVWSIVGLFGGIPALAVYWAAHHSTLAK